MIMILSGSVTSCGLSGKGNVSIESGSQLGDEMKGSGEDGEAMAPLMRVMGEIVSVHPDEKFVLVKRFLQAGAFGQSNLIASVSPEGATSSLILTGEKLGRFYAADVQDGAPSRGDLVIVRRPEGNGNSNVDLDGSSRLEKRAE